MNLYVNNENILQQKDKTFVFCKIKAKRGQSTLQGPFPHHSLGYTL